MPVDLPSPDFTVDADRFGRENVEAFLAYRARTVREFIANKVSQLNEEVGSVGRLEAQNGEPVVGSESSRPGTPDNEGPRGV